MPKQIHQGVGSLSERARRMFAGGEVSGGGPLASYQQYLTQTYAQPVQQSAQQAVGQFVNSVRQKERQYFGGEAASPMQGGLMGSPMPPGGMQAAQHSALEASMPAPDLGDAAPTRGFGGGFLGQPPSPMISPMQAPSGVAFNQYNLAASQLSAPSAPPGATLSDAFASKFGENWADQFSLTTPSNRARLGLV